MANQIVLNRISATCPIFNVVAPADCANGYIVVVGTQAADKTYACAAPVDVDDAGMVMVLDVPLSYEAEKTENDYVIATGQVVRAYAPYVGMVVSIPVANVTNTSALDVGKFVVPKAGAMKPECLDTLATGEEVVFVIDELFTKAGVPMVKIRCIKAY